MSDNWHQNVKSKNREEIITAGRALFLKHNFINVSIKDVCELAKVSRVTFYKHFKSIEQLIFEVQIDILKNMTEFIKENSQNGIDGKGKLKKMLYSWVNFAKENKDQMKFITLFDLYYEAYDSNEELKISYEQFVKTDNKYFLNIPILQGIKEGAFREDLNPVKTGYYIFQTIMGVLQRMSYTKIPEDYEMVTFDDITDSVIDMIIGSISNIT
ncbi:TetR/AcrR family transcriptional regulator [Clostridium manihotivorum]|uniref:TetR/AcrR family transcriptional regulator n=1 Tax=Clostridium manihotivorum TaxID=2320868 RepID=A0A3R5QUZ8_9CLOT|nr:TetR/AcrR family transcriptional regulator [Clostridium manihotivorum]QAA33116.1 TetR/AcrR family transcriptional regulator [Clostridium manihotivorum]